MFVKQNNSKSSLNTTTCVLFTDWSVTLREGRRLRVFENRVLRGIFGAKRDEGGYVDWIGLAQDRDGWRKLVSAVMNLRFP